MVFKNINLLMEQAEILSWCSLSCFSPQDFIKAEPADALRTRVRPLVIVTCANLLYPWMKKKQTRFYNTIILAWSMNDTDTGWSAAANTGILVEISPATFFCYGSVLFFLWPVLLQAFGASSQWEWELWPPKSVCEQCDFSATWDAYTREK